MSKKLSYVLTSLLLVVGASLSFGGLYALNFVKSNLSEQKIYFPDKASLESRGDTEFVKYAGKQVDTAQEAKAFSEYIQGHIEKIAGGQTYSEVSGQYNKLSQEEKNTPEGKKLEGQRLSIFMGETLRGTLLNAYGWGVVGQIATILGILAVLASLVVFLVGASSKQATVKAKKTTSKRKK